MQAKEYLKQIKKLNSMIENKQVELEQLRELSKSISSQPTDQEYVQSSGTSDKVGNIVVKIVDMQCEINDMIDEYIDKKAEITRVIESLECDAYNVLHKRYIQGMTYDSIAESVDLSRQWVMELHNRALEEVNSLITC